MKVIKAYQGEPHEHKLPAICWHCQDIDGNTLGDIFIKAKTAEGVEKRIAKKFGGDASRCNVYLFLFDGYQPKYKAL